MVRIRYLEEAIAERYGEGKMRCPTHLSIGQEAVAAACGIVLNSTDQAFSTHRAHAHYIGKGGSLKRMMAEIYGKATGCAGGKGGSMHLIDLSVGFGGSTAIVGNSIPLAVGAALAHQVLGRSQISCAFFGDAAMEEGVFHESLNFAVLKKLPVLFVCENNLYSVYTPLKYRQPKGRSLWKFAEAYGVTAKYGDGNDAVAAHQLLVEAVGFIRSGQGPVFLEFETYRWREHCGPNFDNHIGYRSEAEFENWKLRDPVSNLRQKLVECFEVGLSELENLEEGIHTEIDEAFEFAESSPFPDSSEAYRDLFASGVSE